MNLESKKQGQQLVLQQGLGLGRSEVLLAYFKSLIHSPARGPFFAKANDEPACRKASEE